MKITKVLIPIDFSSRSKSTIEHGLSIAKRFDAEVVFLHAVQGMPYTAAFASTMPGGMFWTPAPEMEDALGRRLDELIEEVAPGHDGVRLVVKGGAGKVIVETIQRFGVDLVVMPTSGAGAFRRFVLGSVTTQVLNDTECPVLTGPHLDAGDALAPRSFRRIGCALDLDDTAARVVEAAAKFAETYNAEIIGIHALPSIGVGSQGSFGLPKMFERVKRQAEAEIRERFEAVGRQPQVIVEQGQPDKIVSRVAKKQEVDLMVIGRHSEEGVLGGLQTHAYGIIRKSECPVLSV